MSNESNVRYHMSANVQIGQYPLMSAVMVSLSMAAMLDYYYYYYY